MRKKASGVSPSELRVLVVSLSTYRSAFNDGKLAELGKRVREVTAVAADAETLWGSSDGSRSGPRYSVLVLESRFAWSNAITQLVGVRRAAEAVSPNLVHVECEPWQFVAIQAVSAARRLNVPVGIQFAENGPMLEGAGGKLRRSVAKVVLRRCSYALGWSTGSARLAEKLAPRIWIGTSPGTGVATNQLPLSPPDERRWFGSGSGPKIAFVGRFAPEKGLAEFLNVADLLVQRVPIRAAIAGGSATDPTIHGWIATRSWARAHGVLGRPDVADLLSAADVLVCPSRTTARVKEQFGKTAAEAMALGTPVFAFDCGALPEVIGAGGVVVPEGDTRGLAEALERYFSSSSATRGEIEKQALVEAERFTDARLADDLVTIWSRFA